MIDTTVGIESVTWYQRGQSDRRRVQVTFQDALRKDFMGGEKLPGELELFGDSSESPMGRMSLDSPEALDELAKAIELAAQHWRHCIEECPCFEEPVNQTPSERAAELGMKVISFEDFPSDLFVQEDFPEEDDESDGDQSDPSGV